ncbi:hypothetical protein BKA83DRAFT_4068894 [Pisolithus microcarpus]|nr:hypothetical protein BKA83DRAFT_4068894 [Pisolithus microcarpus]
MNDPSLTVRPDFSSEDFSEAQLQLTSDTVDDNQAARTLRTLWDIQNAKDEQMARALAEQEAEESAQRQRRLREEVEAALMEEHRKNKAKYAPVPDKGEYCELYFFTNVGLAEAESFNPSLDDKALTLLKADNGQHVWVPASNTRDKSAIIRDEDLTWEQFGEASVRFLEAMREHNWQEDRVEMHVKFWTALENHPWHHSPLNLLKRALLLYQSQQRQKWHQAIGTVQAFSLAKLNVGVLNHTSEELHARECNEQLDNLRQVSPPPLPFVQQLELTI